MTSTAVVDGLLGALTLATALASALMAGVFFAFSVSVMRALGRLPPPEGIAAMQAINVVIVNPLFLGVFLGAAAGSAFEVIAALIRWSHPGSLYRLAGGVLYLIGSAFVTVAFNVPGNDALARVVPADPRSVGPWIDYLSKWTAWNHVRAAASLVAAALLTAAFRY